MTRTRSGDDATALILKVMELHGELHQHGRRITEPLGQTPARWQVLGAVYQTALTASQIARRMGATRQGIQRVANVLAEEELIEFVDNPDHKRSPMITLTSAGRRVNKRIAERQAVWANAIGKKLPQRVLRDAEKTLDKLVSLLRDMDDNVFA